MSVRAMVPLSMPCSFHMYTPSATPMPNTPLQQQRQQPQHGTQQQTLVSNEQ
jgi:hypothetical protein